MNFFGLRIKFLNAVAAYIVAFGFCGSVFGQIINTGLPVIEIYTVDGAGINSRDIWTNIESFKLTDPNNPANNIERNDLSSKDRIRGRGNSTWSAPKKPYRVRFREDVSFFGLPARENWVLLANYYDLTFIKTSFAFELGKKLNVPYTPTYHHVELYLNNVYLGSYVLTEHRQADPNEEGASGRVLIDPKDGGWFVELDFRYGANDPAEPKFRTKNYNIPILLNSPDFPTGSYTNADDNHVVNDWNELCDLMASADFPENGYRDLVDMEGFVNYFLVQTLPINADFNSPGSVYIHRKDKDAKVSAGPLWDFDLSFGVNWGNSTTFAPLRDPNTRQYPTFSFFARFFQDPLFLVKYKENWNENRSTISSMSQFIDDMANKLRESAKENYKIWRVNEQIDFDYRVEEMKNYLNARIEYLDVEYNKVDILPTSRNFGSRIQNDLISSQTITLVAYGEIEDLQMSFQDENSSDFEITEETTTPAEGGGYLLTVSVKPKDGLTVGTYSDVLSLSGNNQGNPFSFNAPISFAVTPDARLKSLTLSESELIPEFDKELTQYSVNVKSNIEKISITVETNDANATADNISDHPLNVGENLINILVTAEDGETTKTYTVTVIRDDAADATLKSITVSSGELSPSFSANITEYSVNVESCVTSVSITGQPTNQEATVDNVADRELEFGENLIDINVTSEDGDNTKTYTVKVIRASSIGVYPAVSSVLRGRTQQFKSELNCASDAEETVYKNLVLNEISGEHKFVEIYNSGDEPISLEGVRLQRNDGASEWLGTENDIIPAGKYRIFLFNSYTPTNSAAYSGSSTLVDKTKGLETYEEHVGWTVGSGISDQQILKVALIDPDGNEIDVFIRGEEPLPTWGSDANVTRNRMHSYSRMSDGSWAYAIPTPGTENENKESDIVSPGYLTNAKNAPNTEEMTWTVSGNVSSSTTIDEDGLLTIAANETAKTLTVKATSRTNEKNFNTATVNVLEVNITVTPATTVVQKGNSQQFAVKVEAGDNVFYPVAKNETYKNLVLNEVSGEHKFVEIYNSSDDEISLEGVRLQRNDGPPNGSEWVGTASDIIPAKEYRLILFRDYTPASLADNPAYKGWTVTSGISDQQILKVALVDPSGKEFDVFIRGDMPLPAWQQWPNGSIRNRVHSYSRMNDGSWGYSVPTPGDENGKKEGDIVSPGYISSVVVTWEVSGNTSSIDANGLLNVAINESAEILTVTAKSSLDNTRQGSATVTFATVPQAVQNFAAKAGNEEVRLTWTAPVFDGGSAITGYEVSSDNGASWVNASSSTEHTFSGLSNGTSYTFTIRAVNAVGAGAEASATAIPQAATSIHNNDIRNKQSILKNNVVSDKMEIVVEGNVTRVVVYDNLGNVVYDGTETVWDLRNTAGRRVAEGTYLVTAEVRGRDGTTVVYSAKLGVKR